MNIQQKILHKFSKNIEKDFFYNREKFFHGDTNLLYITGFSGSGKTTLSRIAKEIPNVIVTEHDNLDFAHYMPASKLRKEGDLFYSFFKEDEYHYNLLNEHCDNDKRAELYYDFNEYAIKYAKEHPDKIIIIEGTRCLTPYLECSEFDKISDFENLKKSAIIIKETSLVKSYYRAIKRNCQTIDIFREERIRNPFERMRRFIRSIFNPRRWQYYKDASFWFREIKEKLNINQ